jgi:hypothetical protein
MFIAIIQAILCDPIGVECIIFNIFFKNIVLLWSKKKISPLLNSNFIRLWFNTNFEAGLHIKINQLQRIPIVNINLKNPQQKSQHHSIVNNVTQL